MLLAQQNFKTVVRNTYRIESNTKLHELNKTLPPLLKQFICVPNLKNKVLISFILAKIKILQNSPGNEAMKLLISYSRHDKLVHAPFILIYYIINY